MSFESFINNLEEKVKQVESAIQQSINNHNGLLGMLSEAKFYLDAITKAADVIVPGTPVDAAIDALDAELDSLPVSA